MTKLYGYVSNMGAPEYDDIMQSDLPTEEKVKQIQMRGQAYRDELDDQLRKDLAKQYAGAALEIGSAAIPMGAGVKLAGLAGKGLSTAGKYLLSSGLTGGLSGGVFGLGRGLMEDENPLKTMGEDAFIGGLTGLGFGALTNPAKILKPGYILMDDMGNPIPLYHGTASEFEQFDPNMLGSLTGANSAKQGFWFTEGKNTAKSYADYAAENSGINKLLKQQNIAEKAGNWNEYDRLTEEIERLALNSEKPTPRIIEANLDVNNPVTMDAQGKRFMEIQEDINNFLANNPDADSYVIKNLNDAADNNYAEIVNHYMVKNPESIKMRNVYDINDNLIKTFGTDAEKESMTLAQKLSQTAKDMKNGEFNPLKYKGKSVKIGNISNREQEFVFHEIDTHISDAEKLKGKAIRRLPNPDNGKDYIYRVKYDQTGNGKHKITRKYEVTDVKYD